MFSLSKQLGKYIGFVILFLGMLGSGTVAKPLLEDWQLLTSSTVKQGRYNHEAIAMNGYVYIIDGAIDWGVYLNNIERATILPDGTLGPWTTISMNSEKRCFLVRLP